MCVRICRDLVESVFDCIERSWRCWRAVVRVHRAIGGRVLRHCAARLSPSKYTLRPSQPQQATNPLIARIVRVCAFVVIARRACLRSATDAAEICFRLVASIGAALCKLARIVQFVGHNHKREVFATTRRLFSLCSA